MAKRKTTPDVLANRQSKERHTTPLRENSPTAGQPLHATDQVVVEPTSDPFTALFPSPPAVGPVPFSARIKLTVTAGEDIAHEMGQYVSHALSSFPDVRLVQEEAEWTLIVLGVPIQSPNGKTYGIALSTVVTKTVDQQLQESLRSGPLLDPTSASVTSPAQVEAFRGTWLRIGARRRMQQLCEQIVAEFNSRYLDAQRSTRQ